VVGYRLIVICGGKQCVTIWLNYVINYAIKLKQPETTTHYIKSQKRFVHVAFIKKKLQIKIIN